MKKDLLKMGATELKRILVQVRIHDSDKSVAAWEPWVSLMATGLDWRLRIHPRALKFNNAENS